MKKWFLVFFVLFAVLLIAESVEIPISIDKVTNISVPVSVSMNELLDLVGIDFDANWDSLRIYDEAGNELPYQIDDADLNGKLSSGDVLLTLIPGPAKIVVSDDFSIEAPVYDTTMYVKETEEGLEVSGLVISGKVNDHGLLKITKFGNVEGTIVDEIGIARVAGWVGSTYYIDGELGRHEEKTTGNFRVKEVKVLNPGPVAVTIVAELESDTFLGLEQKIVTSVFKNGDIVVNNEFHFKTYADLMKLQNMITRPLTDIADDTVHMLPVFRRLVWADQLNITPLEYWLDRNAVMYVQDKPYIVFPATDPMRPLWWGATYIFASQESWRANYSPSKQIGVAEILPEKPVVYVDYNKWVNGNTWVYESREFRDGIFKWIPGEFEAYEATKGIVSTNYKDWAKHYKAGDVVTFKRIYRIFKSMSIENAISSLELRTLEIQSLSVGK